MQSDWNQNNTSNPSFILNKPVIPAAQVQSNWTEANTAAADYIINKPVIPAAPVQSNWSETITAALDYIQNKPVIPASPVQSNWTETNTAALDYILNKPTGTGWLTPTLASGISNANGFNPCRYMQNVDQVCWLQSCVNGAQVGSPTYTVASAYRPAHTINITAWGLSSGLGTTYSTVQLQLDTSGVLSVICGSFSGDVDIGSAAYTSF